MKHRDLIEHVAKKIAIGNNGGDWATHYTTQQKALWRLRAVEIIKLVQDETLRSWGIEPATRCHTDNS